MWLKASPVLQELKNRSVCSYLKHPNKFQFPLWRVHPWSGLPTECFGLGCECDLVTRFVLATECWTMSVACSLRLVWSFPCLMLTQAFVLLLPFGVRGILNNWKFKHRQIFSTHWNSLPILSYVSLFYYFHSRLHILYYISNPHTLMRGIFVMAGP